MLIIKIILSITFIWVFLQDYKERQVYWFLFPIIGLLAGFLFYKNTLPELFLMASIVNITFVSLLILIVFVYAKFKLHTNILNTIGLGDLFLFLALSVTFSTLSFITIFISALIFSLVIHLFLSRKKMPSNVPLAGYMSVFFLASYAVHWSGCITNLYTI